MEILAGGNPDLSEEKSDSFTLAVLPYGKKIANGAYVCISEKVGVTCGNTQTGKGFRVALAGVTFIG